MEAHARVLRLNKSGIPLAWLSLEEAATLIVKQRVLWSLGDNAFTLHGGYNAAGIQSTLTIPSILASDGDVKANQFQPPKVCNEVLFRRDRHICLYCGNRFATHQLTRDHIIPKWTGGSDRWTNVATSCRRCNQRKGGRTPEQAGMPLLAVPFTPNKMELLVLSNRNILADQMEFLEAGFSKHMRGKLVS